MSALDLSICLTPDQTAVDLYEVLKPFNSTRSTSSSVRITVFPWETYQNELTAVAINGKGPDISQVGAPLVNDLVVMNALRPFTSREIASLGGASSFHTAAWGSSRRVHEGQIWAIPWVADPCAIIYWKDMLSQAGIQEQHAFSSFDHMDHTFQRLQASGVESPWVLPIGNRFNGLQAACTWIWGAGGDFVSADNRIPFFHHPAAISGLKIYFNLYQYMPKEGQPLNFTDANKVFFNRKAAATLSNLTFLHNLPPDLRPKIGVALPPGAPLVGGSSLVIWKHAQNEQEAVELIRYLLSREAQVNYCQRLGYLPVHMEALMGPPYTTEPIERGFAQAMYKGQPFPLIKLGGSLEDKLAVIIAGVWVKLIAGEKIDIDATLSQEFAPIVRNFEQWVK